MHLYQSNRLEHLFSGLCAILTAPPADPLAPETIVVQNPGMARWLSQRIARETGIAANFVFPLPASFIWDIFGHTLGQVPDLPGYDRKVLLWRVLAELDQVEDDPAWNEIRTYLLDDTDGSRRFQLARKISDTLDQYLVYRPEMLLAWERGRDDHWQARLWRRLTAEFPLHRAGLLRDFQAADQAGQLRTDTLPERVFLFGINSLAPAYLDVLARTGRYIDIHVFQLSPCSQAWDDIIARRLLAIKRQSWRRRGEEDISEYFTTGNPLLASMGMAGREFFSQLMDHDPQAVELYEEPEDNTLLGAIQGDILNLADRADNPVVLDPDDTSIRFHCCHSPLREIQILHDRLLDAFATDPELKPADILVMAPNINDYAPAIGGVFGSARGNKYIPWSIADQSRREEQPVLDGFLGLLNLLFSRFTAPEVTALLENPALQRGLDLDTNKLEMLRLGVAQAGIRWGLDQKQRQDAGLDNSPLHTWEFGLERMLLGLATGSLEEPVAGVLPSGDLPGDYTPWLGSLAEFIRSLQEIRRRFRSPCEAQQWKERLLEAMEMFFAHSGPDQEGLLLLRGVITDFADNCTTAGFTGPLDFAVVRRHLEEELAEPAGGQAFLAGKVTFCNMVPMRSVPFPLIWLLGMNDSAYPRTGRPPAFDLIAHNPRLGDRSRRDDDRYLFLEALLSARAALSISWVGRDLQENSELPPSVVVAELRDYIDRGWICPDADAPCSRMLTVEYPLQPFSRRCFDTTPQLASYAEAWLPKTTGDEQRFFIQDPLPEQDITEIDLDQLIRFWNNPVRFFLEQRLGLRLNMSEDQLEESEPFALDHLQQYLLTEEVIARVQAGETTERIMARKLAAAELPRGEIGPILFHGIRQKAVELLRQLQPLTTEPRPSADIDLEVAGLRIFGRLDRLHSTGRVVFRPATLKSRDLLKLWLNHLLLCLVRPDGVALESFHAAKNTTVRLGEAPDPGGLLEPFLQYYRIGLTRPLHFYPETGLAWASAKEDSARMSAARRAWESGNWSRGEEDDPGLVLALAGREPLDDEFTRLATLFLPLLELKEEYHAAP